VKEDGSEAEAQRSDLRMVAVAAAAWLGCLAGAGLSGRWALGLLVLLAGGAVVVRRRPTWVGLLLVAAAAVGVAALRVDDVVANPVATLARDEASVRATLTVTSDPRPVTGGFGDGVVLRARVAEVSGRGANYSVREPVLVIGGDAWLDVPLGSTVVTSARLAPPEDRDVAAVMLARGSPQLVGRPGVGWRLAAALRGGVREAVAHRPADQAALVPALVDGDDAGVDEGLADDFRVTGLTHLLAVSGTNLTLVVGALLIAARWAGVRGRWLTLVAALGIAGFVVLARTEPSVLRAAAMGTVGLVALAADGRRRGPRALGVAVVVLLLLDPWLAGSPGFALSALATAGIVLLAPAWRDALGRWLPRWVAEAVSVPAAATLACLPVVAALSGQVSLVSVFANLAAAPAVGPATVLGLLAGLVHLVWPAAGAVLGTLAGWCVGWIVTVAEHGASVPTPALEWGTGAVSLAALVLACVVVAVLAPRVLARPLGGGACCVLLVVAALVRPPSLGWPPDGWVVVACDVGQGDALALSVGPGSAVVVDAGPDPRAVDRCLDRLGVRDVPLLVLSHFHADHVDGLPGVLAGRSVGAVAVTPLADPPAAVDGVRREVGELGLVPFPLTTGQTLQVGPLSLQALWPPPETPTVGPGDGSTANEASVVLLGEVRGVRLLLGGDVEPEGQAAIARASPGLEVDVLKLPHHGSRYQDEGWLLSLGAEVTLVSVGADNDYGHPAATALDPLAAAGSTVLRTDLRGDIAVLLRDGRLQVATAR